MSGDATWTGEMTPEKALIPLGPDVYSLLVTFGGAAVHQCTKKLGLLVDNSQFAEAVATSKLGEINSYSLHIHRGLGIPRKRPTIICSDNKANALIGSEMGNSSRAKHSLRRYLTFLQRTRAGECVLRHVPDVENPSDFLTKWVGRDKLRRSLAYATNSRNAVGK
jgi:hypothetical protein